MTQDVIYPGECSVCLRRMYILLLFDGMFIYIYICLLDPFGLKCGSSPIFPY